MPKRIARTGWCGNPNHSCDAKWRTAAYDAGWIRRVTFARQSLGSLAALVFGVAVSVLLPRVLGPDARGEYQLAVKLAGLVLAVAQWGIPEVLLQMLAERRASTGALVGTSLVLGVVGAAVAAVLIGFAAPM